MILASPNNARFQEEHIANFNPTFKKATTVDVVVKEGLLDAKNHTTVVFKNNT